MESENEYWDDFISNQSSNINSRSQWIIISWINGKVLQHTDVIKPEYTENSEGNILLANLQIDASSNLLIDINQQLSKLTPSEIDIFTLKSLFPYDRNIWADSDNLEDQVMKEEKELVQNLNKIFMNVD